MGGDSAPISNSPLSTGCYGNRHNAPGRPARLKPDQALPIRCDQRAHWSPKTPEAASRWIFDAGQSFSITYYGYRPVCLDPPKDQQTLLGPETFRSSGRYVPYFSVSVTVTRDSLWQSVTVTVTLWLWLILPPLKQQVMVSGCPRAGSEPCPPPGSPCTLSWAWRRAVAMKKSRSLTGRPVETRGLHGVREWLSAGFPLPLQHQGLLYCIIVL